MFIRLSFHLFYTKLPQKKLNIYAYKKKTNNGAGKFNKKSKY